MGQTHEIDTLPLALPPADFYIATDTLLPHPDISIELDIDIRMFFMEHTQTPGIKPVCEKRDATFDLDFFAMPLAKNLIRGNF
ncbi:hypothetical protein NUKP61_39740 [Klebsiella variicola]|nr:hypothetical protein NUKP61_39740 [Klebsiella variicola]